MKNKVYILDITGRVVDYDIGLFDAIVNQAPDIDVKLIISDAPKAPNRVCLLSLIPAKFKSSNSKIKRAVKAVETVLNYIYILFLSLFERPSVLHFQWFTFMEFCSLDNYYISLLKFLLPNVRIVLTVHNLYPHDMSNKDLKKYESRFEKMCKHIDHFIVHVESTKNDLVKIYSLEPNQISVIPHGVFAPAYEPVTGKLHNGHHIIMYGNITTYKGADVLLDALNLLPEDVKKGIKVTVAGRIAEDYLKELQKKVDGVDVCFIPSFIPEEQLYRLIDDADYIALPYREISQSGVLLLALFFKKLLLISDLPSFIETLKGFS